MAALWTTRVICFSCFFLLFVSLSAPTQGESVRSSSTPVSLAPRPLFRNPDLLRASASPPVETLRVSRLCTSTTTANLLLSARCFSPRCASPRLSFPLASLPSSLASLTTPSRPLLRSLQSSSSRPRLCPSSSLSARLSDCLLLPLLLPRPASKGDACVAPVTKPTTREAMRLFSPFPRLPHLRSVCGSESFAFFCSLCVSPSLFSPPPFRAFVAPLSPLSPAASPSSSPFFSGVQTQKMTSKPESPQRCLGRPAPADLPLGLDPFCYRQFDDPAYGGSRISGVTKEEFLEKVNELVTRDAGIEFFQGYAPFCRHLYIPNFVGALPGSLPITADNEHLLRSGYIARRPNELPVLTRWFPMSYAKDALMPAAFLDLILYSREQIAKETAAESNTAVVIDPNAPAWSIIAVKAQNEKYSLPMAPITMLRNTLIEEGGSGVALDREAYKASVAYWKTHAIVMDKESSLE
ncbi:DUF3228 domain-containing protein [Toxoplasma gondii VEG]|uniref:DUF3228 domain-containing protein n=3 Tax=Toxoplasma gondii TaxID=5811 RepID=V4ZLH4_TOXGV|nr:DUF3228 domain-containing protein [Toxoplasma gondii VEG]KFG46181.1 DUF3228 domain-containing protein [Toxoplasma gondii p89]